MKRKKLFWGTAAGILIVLLLVLILAIWSQFYFVVNFKIYPKNARSIDLRGEEITAQEIDKIQKQAPGCFILWNAPFQGEQYPSDTAELTVTELTAEGVAQLDCFPLLKLVHAEDCDDYDQLLALQNRRPEVELSYDVKLGGETYSRTSAEITVSGISREEIPFLDCLTGLETVTVSAEGGTENIGLLQSYCKERGVSFFIEAGGETVEDTVESLTLSGVTDAELDLLAFLPDLRKLHLVDPEASAEKLVSLRSSRTETEITWEKQIWGQTVSNAGGALDDLQELDLSETEYGHLSQIEEAMPYFPEIRQVFLGECGIDNEEIAAFRERVRPDYKVVWTVVCGSKKNGFYPLRSDETYFMPIKQGIYYFFDEDAYNLRYCEDMIAIDVGHMSIKDISFVSFMPNLKYLILAHTQVRDITPISSCKSLVFLELDWTPIRDYTPLQGCTALEDLNIGKFGADVTPICEMTWLKNIWVIFRPNAASKLASALPDTKIVSQGNATVASGWRNLPNYFAMRDALGMYYMTW